MDRQAHDKWMEEFDREAIEISRARRADGKPGIPADRFHALLVELERRFTAVGHADPIIAKELCDKLKKGEPF